ncbi:YdeI/OmpD-associated family protein [Microbacterium sp. 2FI]|uniref:YdeI/OmpD-associated family protein n=1 Tax=Microbacterium sp. 2FI TaxID=2502193 RepID=UPI0010F5F527|nr:YdeI/OmpD-associated family protein [Microbacterium sp. 2FI]
MGVHDDAERLRFRDAAAWRAWLAENHATSSGVWVLRARAGVDLELISYLDIVLQALCFGWIDGTVKPMDDETNGQWCAPRRPNGNWAATNKARVIQLEESGQMTDAGRRAIEVAKANGSWTILDGPEAGIEPPEFTAALDAVPAARAAWNAFPPSTKKFALSQIAMAKRSETKTARIEKIVADAAEGKRP